MCVERAAAIPPRRIFVAARYVCGWITSRAAPRHPACSRPNGRRQISRWIGAVEKNVLFGVELLVNFSIASGIEGARAHSGSDGTLLWPMPGWSRERHEIDQNAARPVHQRAKVGSSHLHFGIENPNSFDSGPRWSCRSPPRKTSLDRPIQSQIKKDSMSIGFILQPLYAMTGHEV
jgi:hypothetical protein